jgi:hypothetical protein
MDNSFALDAVAVLFLDDRCAVARLTLLDDRTLLNAVSIVIPVAFASRYASANRTYANPDFISDGRSRKATERGGNQQILLHLVFSLQVE